MGGRTAIAVGLAAGVVAGVAALALVAALLPPPDPMAVVPSASAGSPRASMAAPSAGTSPTAPTGEGEFHVGEAAPALRLPQLGGGEVDLASLRGSPVWVNFMGTYCPPCRDELPLMNSFYVRYGESGLVVVAVDVREDVGTVDAFAKELSVQFPMALDEDAAAQRAWGAYALPVHFWIDREGIVRYGALGGIGPDVMAEGLRAILPGVDVQP